jgi:hypothetical protein
MEPIRQKLLFVLGKGGVGRTTCAMALATAFAQKGERVLVVQWALQDALSPRYGLPSVGHTEREVMKNISTMNFNVDEAMREYFVDHLGMRLLHSIVIENKHVQRLIHAAPGVQELFFLGRLLWLVELAQEARGWSYNRVIVDTPATGHGVSLFTIAPTIASFGMTGPLAHECERVSRLLADATKVGTVFVTLPEELPVEETLESLPKLQRELGRPPLLMAINKSISRHSQGDAQSLASESWYLAFSQSLGSDAAREGARLLLGDLLKRNAFERQLASACAQQGIPVAVLSDVALTHPELAENEVPAFLANELREIELRENELRNAGVAKA